MKITRRTFLKTGLAGAVTLAAASLIPGFNHIFTWAEDIDTRNIRCLREAGFTVDRQTVTVPGLRKSYRFAFLSDLHILIPNEEVSDEAMETVKERYEKGFIDPDGTPSCLLWDKLTDAINELEIDALLLGADMIDYFSQANFDCLRKGCQKLRAPFMYIRADHDYSDSYSRRYSQEAVDEAEQALDGDREIACLDYGEFLLAGISKSTGPISAEGLKELERLFGLGLPVVLITHVPFDSLIDDSLNKASREVWQDRALLWGYQNTLYSPTEEAKHMLDMLYAPDSPVAAVFGGHLHFRADVRLTETIPQHVFDAAFRGNVGYIIVSS